MLVNDVELETDLGRFLILHISSQPRMMSLVVISGLHVAFDLIKNVFVGPHFPEKPCH